MLFVRFNLAVLFNEVRAAVTAPTLCKLPLFDFDGGLSRVNLRVSDATLGTNLGTAEIFGYFSSVTSTR